MEHFSVGNGSTIIEFQGMYMHELQNLYVFHLCNIHIMFDVFVTCYFCDCINFVATLFLWPNYFIYFSGPDSSQVDQHSKLLYKP